MGRESVDRQLGSATSNRPKLLSQIKGLEKKPVLPSTSAVEVVLESNRQALSKYQLRPYPGQITLFRAEDPDDGYIYPIDNGWTRYAEGGLQIYKNPGQHQQIFVTPTLACWQKSWKAVSMILAPKSTT
jgi:thioesterase domain-containing protein